MSNATIMRQPTSNMRIMAAVWVALAVAMVDSTLAFLPSTSSYGGGKTIGGSLLGGRTRLALSSEAKHTDDDSDESFEYWYDPLLSGGTGGSSSIFDSSSGPEKSQMKGFISDFLQRQQIDQDEQDKSSSNNDSAAFTHLIAVPMGECHELALELESVQRGILYHCPVLVHSCIVSAMTRLPLLYVQAPSAAHEHTQSLNNLVAKIVQKHLFVTEQQQDTGDDGVEPQPGMVDDDHLGGVNEDGYRPLMVPFEKLEIDGVNNEVLYTVAKPDDPGTRQLQGLVEDLQKSIAEAYPNWSVSLPPDETAKPKTIGRNDHGTRPVFRPRIPFMRIPVNFADYLEPLESEDSEVEPREEYTRTSDEGGNGISPIFWASWWDDRFGTARLQEIGVFPRVERPESVSSSTSVKTTPLSELSEDKFYLPQQSTPLPGANAILRQNEQKFAKYQEQRMKQAEYDLKQDKEQSLASFRSGEKIDKDDMLLAKTRARLESLFEQGNVGSDSRANEIIVDDDDYDDEFVDWRRELDLNRPVVDTSALDDWTRERIEKANAARGLDTFDVDNNDKSDDAVGNNDSKADTSSPSQSTSTPNDLNKLHDSTRERIRKAVNSREVVQSKQNLAKPKEKPPIAENPVFQNFKDGTLVRKQAGRDVAQPDMPPFPAREHFIGFWRVMSSPTGFPLDLGTDGSRSENLILRVDGTIAGGPILDPVTNQKAAGGTWKMLIDEKGENSKSAHLRIRLVIPPKKERILVLEGKAMQQSTSLDLPPMARSTFGIPALEDKAQRAKETDQDSLDVRDAVHCGGKVWIEDAITGKNKDVIGTFSLQKLNTPDPSQLTITIPKPIRNQD